MRVQMTQGRNRKRMCDSEDGHQCCAASPQEQCIQTDTNGPNWFETVILIQPPHEKGHAISMDSVLCPRILNLH